MTDVWRRATARKVLDWRRWVEPEAWWPDSFGAQLLLLVQTLALLGLTAAVALQTWQDREWLGYLMLGGATLVWLPALRAQRIRRVWFLYVAGLFLYTLLRARADDTGMPIHFQYPIRIDQFLFFGYDPVVVLQRQWFQPWDINWFDWTTVSIHWSFFLVPHAFAIFVFLFQRPLFTRYTVMMIATMYLALIIFFLLPTAPPWLAAREGEFPLVFRVMHFTARSVSEETYDDFYETLGEPNSVAAMPSLHMGITFLMFLFALDHFRRFSIVCFLYSVVMGFSLVYMAEHYVADLIAGMAAAGICWWYVRKHVPLHVPGAQRSDAPPGHG